eukprot:evm.model.scf_484.4 EVM.evm.TU.scf_484.4   scf_484:52548-57212(-)
MADEGRQEPNAAWNRAAGSEGAPLEAMNERTRKLEWDLKCSKRAYDRQYALHKDQVDLDARLREEVRELECATDRLERQGLLQLRERRRMAAEELRAWRTKLDEQKAVGARWIARGREQLKDILNTLEMEKAAIAERRRAAEAKMVDVERSKVPPCLQEDVEQLKKMSSALEAEVPAKKANVKKLNACVEEMTARLARKKKILRQYLEQVKKLKTQQKLANRFSATPKESWVGPTPPFYIDRHKSGRQNQGLVYGSVTVADDENGQPHTEKVLKRPGIVPILYYCDGVPLMSTGGGTPPIKSYLLHTIREESGPREDSAEADKSPCVGEEEGANGKHAEHKDCMEPESLPCPSTRGAAGSPSTPRCTITSAARTATTAKRIQSPKSGDAQESAKARPSAKRSKTSTSGGKVFWTDYRAWRQENECKPYLQEQTWLKEVRHCCLFHEFCLMLLNRMRWHGHQTVRLMVDTQFATSMDHP